jgi:hypothetical protein
MRKPVLGNNLVQSFLDFETIGGKLRWGIEGPDQRMFCETSSGKVYLTDTSGYQCADVINDISGNGIVVEGVKLLDGNITSSTSISGVVTGVGLYINKTANTAGTLKIHCHQMAASTDDSPNQYANEFKGEFLATSGTMDGIASHFHMNASSTGILRSILGVAYLDSGKTLSGTDYTTGSWLVGGLFSANVAGVLNGSGVVVAGLYGGIASCVGSTLTACKYLTSIWADSSRLVTLSSGQSSLILATNQTGALAVNYGLRMESANLITTGISLSGNYTTGIELGVTGTRLTLTDNTSRIFSSFATCSDTAAHDIVSMSVNQYMTGASSTNMAEVGQFFLTSNVQTGNWVNALSAKIDFSTAGYVTGLAGVICAELDMPGGAVPGGNGTYTCFEAELNLPTSFSGGGVPVSFFALNV